MLFLLLLLFVVCVFVCVFLFIVFCLGGAVQTYFSSMLSLFLI